MKVERVEKDGPYECDECEGLHDWIFKTETYNIILLLCEQCTDKLAKELTFVLKY